MNILVIGGTRFVGRALTDALLAKQHTVTLFNRGTSNPNLYPNVETIKGDRDGDLSELAGREWDAVIDTCGYVPRIVRKSAEALSGCVGQYVFISTLSVFKTQGGALTENSALNTLSDPTTEEINGETYGGLKVLCEKEVLKAFPNNSLIVRPGVIVGAHDPTDRFTYWVERAAQDGEILVPAPSDRKVEFIDARDLAEFTVSMIERKQHGIFNTVDSSDNLTLERVLSQTAELFNSNIALKWAEPELLEKHKIESWSELPLCLPNDRRLEEWTDCSAAIAQGLRFRPLETIIADTLEWSRSRGSDYQLKAGLSVEKEAKALKELTVSQP